MNGIKKAAVVAATAGIAAFAAAGTATADAGAGAGTVGSPGVLSGNVVQVPVHLPANACGNTVSVVGLLNPAAGSACANR